METIKNLVWRLVRVTAIVAVPCSVAVLAGLPMDVVGPCATLAVSVGLLTVE